MNNILKGQAWITPDGSLMQEQTLITPKGVCNNTVALVKDIWADLNSDNGTYKFNNTKNFFYWEYKRTTLEGDEEITELYECPRPKDGMFKEPYDPEKVKGEWAKYWVRKFKTTSDNYAKTATIQPTKVIFPETEYIKPDGTIEKVKERIVEREDTSEITNLLSIF